MIGEETFIVEGKKRRTAIIVLCNHCGAEFAKRKDLALSSSVHYCSRECLNMEQMLRLSDGTDRVCTKCEKSKPVTEFYDRKDRKGKRSLCIECWTGRTTARTLEKRKQEPFKYSALSYKSTIKMKYGISIEEYDRLLKLQDGKCALCRKPEVRRLRGNIARLSVDHCHVTGKIRGLLCSKCNTAIGLFEDNKELMQKAIEYLEASREGTFV